MYLYVSSSNEPPMGRLALAFCAVGVLAVAPLLSWCLLRVLVVAGVLDPADDRTVIWVWLGAWAVGNGLWLALSRVLDAWDAARCAHKHAQSDGPVILHRRNRMLVRGELGPAGQITWCCLGLGVRVVLYPASTVLCVVAAYGFATIEEAPNSVGPQPLIALCFVVAAVVVTAATVNHLWERLHLLRHGRLVTGTVRDAGPRDSEGGSRVLRGDYRFALPSGEQQVDSEHLSCRPRRMPKRGDELVILHDTRLGPLVL